MYFFFDGSSSLHCVFPLFFLIPSCTHCVYFHHCPLFHFEYFAYFWLPIVLRYWDFPLSKKFVASRTSFLLCFYDNISLAEIFYYPQYILLYRIFHLQCLSSTMILLSCSEYFPCFLSFCVLPTISFDMVPLNISICWNSFFFSTFVESYFIISSYRVYSAPILLGPTILPLSIQWIPPFPCVIISIASSHSIWYPLFFYRVFPLMILLLFVCVTLQKCYTLIVSYGSILHIWIVFSNTLQSFIQRICVYYRKLLGKFSYPVYFLLQRMLMTTFS